MIPTTTKLPCTNSDTSLFGALDEDSFRHVLKWLRSDRYGNTTVTGHVLEAVSWRPLSHRFLDASRTQHGDFDAAVTTLPSGEVDQFTGGMRFTPRDAAHAFYLVRDARTGQVHALTCTGSTNDDDDDAVVPRQRVCALEVRHLARVLSGHNANFEQRLTNFDRIAVHGMKPRVSPATYLSQGEQVVAGSYLGVKPGPTAVAFGVGRAVHRGEFGITFKAEASVRNNAVVHHIVPTIEISPPPYPFPSLFNIEVPPQLADGAPGERVGAVRSKVDAMRKPGPSLPHLSIAFGWYHDAADVECQRWQVSLYRPNLAPKFLLPKPRPTDPECATRFLADLALSAAKREENARRAAATTAIVVFDYAEDARRRALLRHGGPAASLVTQPRESAERARANVWRLGKELRDTDGWGRLRREHQPADSRADEAEGLIDDRFRSSDDDSGASEEDDDAFSDEDYAPPPASRARKRPAPAGRDRGAEGPSRNVTEAVARAIAMRRFVSICSSDEEDEEDEDVHEASVGPPGARDDFCRNARQALDDLLDF